MLDSVSTENIFRTPDTATAAYLILSNFNLLRIETPDNDHHSVFVFEASNGIEQFAKSFEMGTAIGNLKAFFKQYRSLLREVK